MNKFIASATLMIALFMCACSEDTTLKMQTNQLSGEVSLVELTSQQEYANQEIMQLLKRILSGGYDLNFTQSQIRKLSNKEVLAWIYNNPTISASRKQYYMEKLRPISKQQQLSGLVLSSVYAEDTEAEENLLFVEIAEGFKQSLDGFRIIVLRPDRATYASEGDDDTDEPETPEEPEPEDPENPEPPEDPEEPEWPEMDRCLVCVSGACDLAWCAGKGDDCSSADDCSHQESFDINGNGLVLDDWRP